MNALILFLVTIASFLLYGVVGEDKTWLLSPAFVLTYVVTAVSMLKLARCRVPRDSRLNAAGSIPPAGLLFMLFLLWSAALIPQSTVPFESKVTVLFIGGVIGAYLVWSEELTAFKDNRLVLGFLIAVITLLALYGLVIHFRAPDSILWSQRYTDHYSGRLASTYICPNHFAHLLQMLMPFCLALCFIPQSGAFLRLLSAYSLVIFLPALFLTESRAGWLGAMVAVGITICLMALRRSRKLFVVLVILVPMLSAILLYGAWRFSETFQRRMTPVIEFMKEQAEGGVGSDVKDFRPQTWMDTVDMIRESPVIGFGPGNYRYAYPEHRKRFRGSRIVTGHPHNEYLELIADFGLIGFGIFALAWCYGLIRVLVASLKTKEIRHAYIGFALLGTAAGTMVHSFFDFQMHVYPNALVFSFLAAAAVGPLLVAGRRTRGGRSKDASQNGSSKPLSGDDKIARKDPEERANPSAGNRLVSYLRFAGTWVLVLGYLAGALLCFQMMGTSWLRASADQAAQSARRSPDTTLQVRRRYELAARIDPQNWRAYKGMAELIYQQRYYSLDRAEKVRLVQEEIQWYESAHVYNPKNPETAAALGKSLIFLGRVGRTETDVSMNPDKQADEYALTPAQHIDRGIGFMREACRYRPYNDVYWWNLGVELRKLGQYDEALEVFRKARSIHRTPSTDANIKWIEKQMQLEAADAGQSAGETGNTQQTNSEEWVMPDPREAEAASDLMNLFERMGE